MTNLSCVIIKSHICLSYLDYTKHQIPLTNIYVEITVILKQAEKVCVRKSFSIILKNLCKFWHVSTDILT